MLRTSAHPARHGTARHGKAWHGTARHGLISITKTTFSGPPVDRACLWCRVPRSRLARPLGVARPPALLLTPVLAAPAAAAGAHALRRAQRSRAARAAIAPGLCQLYACHAATCMRPYATSLCGRMGMMAAWRICLRRIDIPSCRHGCKHGAKHARNGRAHVQGDGLRRQRDGAAADGRVGAARQRVQDHARPARAARAQLCCCAVRAAALP